MANTNVLQIHSVICDNVVDVNFHKRLLILFIVAVKGKVSEAFDKSHRVFLMLWVCVVELGCGDPIFVLEELTCQLFPSSNGSRRMCSIPSVGTVKETFLELFKIRVIIAGMRAQSVDEMTYKLIWAALPSVKKDKVKGLITLRVWRLKNMQLFLQHGSDIFLSDKDGPFS